MIKQPFCIWFTGLPRAGKTTLALALQEELEKRGVDTLHLDGDFVRENLWRDLEFTKEDRNENIKRVIILAKFCQMEGRNVITSFISPYRELRRKARQELGNFVEVYVKCPIEVCKSRDVAGMYVKAEHGEIKNFTGVSDPYEEPESPEVICNTDVESVEESGEKIIEFLKGVK